MKKTAILLCAILLLASVSPFAAAENTEELLYSFTFDDEKEAGELFTLSGESAAQEWVNSPGIGYEDDTALKLTHIEGASYTSSDNAVRLTLPEPLPAGGVYRIKARVYAPSEHNPDKTTLTGPGFVLNADYGGAQGEVKFPPDFGTLPMDEWMLIDVTLPLQEDPVESLDFRIVINDAPKHPDVWYWDGIEIYQVGELTVIADPAADSENPVITKSKSSTFDGFDYELWSERSSDEVSMTLTGGGTFQCSWNALNILFRTGKKLGSTTTYEEYGEIVMDYGAVWNITKGSVNYLCVYGWTVDPLVEFYIIESHGDYKPPGGVGYQGTYEADGSVYELYVDTRVDKPSIQGTATFKQYFGVRKDKRTEGTITISDHFKAWDNMGMDMSGKMYEVALCVEGFNSAGTAEVYSHRLSVGGETFGFVSDKKPEPPEPSPSPEPSPVPPPEPEPSPEVSPETPAQPSPSPETNPPGEETPSNLPLLIGIIAAVIAAGAAVFMIMNKKR